MASSWTRRLPAAIMVLNLLLPSVSAHADIGGRQRAWWIFWNPPEVYQRPDVIVRVYFNRQSFIKQGQGVNVDTWEYYTQWAMKRWNERSGNTPRFEWAGYTTLPGHVDGELTVDMVGSVSGGDGFAQATTYQPIDFTRPPGEASGGRISIAKTQGGSTILWGLKPNITGSRCINAADTPCAAAVLLHEFGHIWGLDHSTTNGCPATFDLQTVDIYTMSVMFPSQCDEITYFQMHGPGVQEIVNNRRAQGNTLQRLTNTIKHNKGGSTASLVPESDNASSETTASGVSVAASASPNTPRWSMAWRGTNNQDRVSILRGVDPTSWDIPGKITVNTGNFGSIGQPALAAASQDNFLLAIASIHDTDNTISRDRNIRYINYSSATPASSFTYTLFNPSSSLPNSAEAPAVAFVRPSTANNGYWVIAWVDLNQAQIKFTRAPVVDPPPPPGTALAWMSPAAITFPGNLIDTINGVGGISLACKGTPGGTDSGRCLISFGTDAHRQEEGSDQPGFLRTYSFTVNVDGSVTQANNVSFGFGSSHRTFQSTTMAWNQASKKWFFGWAQNLDSCWRANENSAGSSFWPVPISSCPIIFGSGSGYPKPLANPALVASDNGSTIWYYRPE